MTFSSAANHGRVGGTVAQQPRALAQRLLIRRDVRGVAGSRLSTSRSRNRRRPLGPLEKEAIHRRGSATLRRAARPAPPGPAPARRRRARSAAHLSGEGPRRDRFQCARCRGASRRPRRRPNLGSGLRTQSSAAIDFAQFRPAQPAARRKKRTRPPADWSCRRRGTRQHHRCGARVSLASR